MFVPKLRTEEHSTMNKQNKGHKDEEAYRATLLAVRRLNEKQKARLLAELQGVAFRLDLPDVALDVDLSGIDLNLELPELDLSLPNLEKPTVFLFCGQPSRG
jgi:hypothetical protein